MSLKFHSEGLISFYAKDRETRGINSFCEFITANRYGGFREIQVMNIFMFCLKESIP